MIGDILGGLGGMIGGIASLGQDDEEAKRLLDTLRRMYEDIGLPEFNEQTLTPESYQYAGDYVPKTYDPAVMYDPRYVTEGPEGRQGQVDALRYFQDMSRTDIPLSDQIARQEASSALGQQYGRNDQAILENMQRRGMGGGGNQIKAQIAQQQGNMDLARGMGQDLTQQAIQSRLQAAANAGSMGGQLRGQDQALSGQNADIWNRFGEWLSNTMTQARAANAATQNAAQLRNVGEKQRLGEQNTATRNEYDVRNQTYLNSLKQNQFGNEMQKMGGIAGIGSQQANDAYARAAADRDMALGLGQAAGQTLGGAFDMAAGAGAFGADPFGIEAAKDREAQRQRTRLGF